MREILFRGQIVDSDKWVYGDLLQYRVYPVIFDSEKEQHEVKQETVGQFTGLKDKEGTKIFEGDALQFKIEKEFNDGVNDCYENGHVQWCDDGFWTTDFDASLGEEIFNDSHAKVIGNIHDIPELLLENQDETL